MKRIVSALLVFLMLISLVPTTVFAAEVESTSSDSTITVYFTNNDNWSSVKIYYWGSEQDTVQWPGKDMSYVSTNNYNEDVYSLRIPSDVKGITFNDDFICQTVDITERIYDGAGWYLQGCTVNYFTYDVGEYEFGKPLENSKKSFGGHTYQVLDYAVTWSEAKEKCEELGGHLVTINSAAENEFLVELSKESIKRNLWIGAKTDGSQYYWITGESFSYTNWEDNEPNNVDDYQYTAMMYTYRGRYTEGKWNDENENGRDWSGYYLTDFGFICEWEEISGSDGYNSVEQYMVDVIIDDIYIGSLNCMQGSTPQNFAYKYIMKPEQLSLSRVYVDLLDDNAGFQFSVAGWKTLSFSPDQAVASTMSEVGYYEAVILNIINSSLEQMSLDSAKKAESTLSSIKTSVLGSLRIDATIDRDALLNKSWDMYDEKEQFEICEAAVKKCKSLNKIADYADDITDLIGTTVTVIEFAQKLAALEQIAEADQYVCEVLEALDNNCPLSNVALKTAINEIKTVCSSAMDKAMVMIIDSVALGTEIVAKDGIKLLWTEVITSSFPSIGTGILIGQVIGTGLSNFLFSTDATIEKYYVMKCMVEFEDVMVSVVKQMENNYKSNRSSDNAKAFLTAVKMLIKTYALSADYAQEYKRITETEGLVNGIATVFGFGNKQNYEDFSNTCKSVKASLSTFKDVLADYEFSYSKGLKTDDNDMYSEYELEKTKTNEYWNSKIITVACPTDVVVYSGEKLIAKIVSNDVVGMVPGVIVYVSDDTKHIILPSEMNYSIQVTGTDNGTMDCILSSLDNGTYSREILFDDVPLTQESVYNVDNMDFKRDIVLINENGEKILPTVDINRFEFQGASLTLGGDIGVNFYMNLSDEVIADKNAKVVFSLPNGSKKSVAVNSIEPNEDGCYVYTCEVAAKEMTKTISAQVVTSDYESEVYEYSVLEYADYILTEAEAGNETYTAAAPLVKAMLNYGAYAQQFFGYNTENLANDILEDAEKVLEENVDLSEFSHILTDNDENVDYYGSKLTLESETAIKHYFKVKNEAEIPVFYVNGTETEVDKKDGLYEVIIKDIPAQSHGDKYVVTAGELSLDYNVLSYGNLALNSNDENLKNVIRALYAYSLAAKEYLAQQ